MIVDGVNADGVKVDGVNVDGVHVDGVNADYVSAALLPMNCDFGEGRLQVWAVGRPLWVERVLREGGWCEWVRPSESAVRRNDEYDRLLQIACTLEKEFTARVIEEGREEDEDC